jgi:hypothetical protein
MGLQWLLLCIIHDWIERECRDVYKKKGALEEHVWSRRRLATECVGQIWMTGNSLSGLSSPGWCRIARNHSYFIYYNPENYNESQTSHCQCDGNYMTAGWQDMTATLRTHAHIIFSHSLHMEGASEAIINSSQEQQENVLAFQSCQTSTGFVARWFDLVSGAAGV